MLLVGPHDAGDRAVDVYTRLYELLDLEVPRGERTKPRCCDADGDPPILDETEIDPFNART